MADWHDLVAAHGGVENCFTDGPLSSQVLAVRVCDRLLLKPGGRNTGAVVCCCCWNTLIVWWCQGLGLLSRCAEAGTGSVIPAA